MILSTVLRQRFDDLNAWCCAKKKGDRIYTPTARTRRISCRSSGIIWLEYRKRESGQKDYVRPSQCDSWQKCWPGRRRRANRWRFENRVKTSPIRRSIASLSPSFVAIAIYRERSAFADQNGLYPDVERKHTPSRSFAVICVAPRSTLSSLLSGHHSRGHFRESRDVF